MTKGTQEVFARVHLKKGIETFYRCGIQFTRDWQQLEVDAATAARLKAEQMLEVVDTAPAGFAQTAEAPVVDAPVTDATVAVTPVADAVAIQKASK